MRSLKHRAVFYAGLVVFLVLVTVSTTMGAFAAGSLTETGPTSASATPVTLTGADQTTIYSLGLTVEDTTGTGAGWNLTITSTTFTSGAKSLSTTASKIQTTPTVTCNGGGNHCTNPDDSAIHYPIGVPAGAAAPTAVKFFDAAVNTGTNNGNATFTITPTITIAIPANTFAGTYTSTVTIAIASGP